MVHTGIDIHLCFIAIASTQLIYRQFVHLGERPHSCPICKKAYTQYANMKKHMLVHTKSKQSV